ncbi:unnamed protein product, partial [Mycena citricolor]
EIAVVLPIGQHPLRKEHSVRLNLACFFIMCPCPLDLLHQIRQVNLHGDVVLIGTQPVAEVFSECARLENERPGSQKTQIPSGKRVSIDIEGELVLIHFFARTETAWDEILGDDGPRIAVVLGLAVLCVPPRHASVDDIRSGGSDLDEPEAGKFVIVVVQDGPSVRRTPPVWVELEISFGRLNFPDHCDES